MDVGELLIRFIDYYATFDFKESAISMPTASVVPRSVWSDARRWAVTCAKYSKMYEQAHSNCALIDVVKFAQ